MENVGISVGLNHEAVSISILFRLVRKLRKIKIKILPRRGHLESEEGWKGKCPHLLYDPMIVFRRMLEVYYLRVVF